MTDPAAPASKQDRLLGDEWENWSGSLDESTVYNETARLFVMYATLATLLVFFALGAILYLIEPRLALIHPLLVVTARILTILTIAGLGVYAILVMVSAYTGRQLFLSARIGGIAASLVLPLALFLAAKLGISRDKLGNSFVSFHNAVIRAGHRPTGGKTIILLPRCLSLEQKKEIQAIAERAGVLVFTATGGGQARKVIIQEHPAAVIGVACERDLISGIHDIAPKMPTIGVPNKRPEGPCKNTIIDLNDLRQAIATLTGVTVD